MTTANTGAWGDDVDFTPETPLNTSPVRNVTDLAVEEFLNIPGAKEALVRAYILCQNDESRQGLIRMLRGFVPRDGFRTVQNRQNRGHRGRGGGKPQAFKQRRTPLTPPDGFKFLHDCVSNDCTRDEAHFESHWHRDTIPKGVTPYCRYCAMTIADGDDTHCKNKGNINFEHLVTDTEDA